MKATIRFQGGPLDGYDFLWPRTIDDLPGWLGGGQDFDPTTPAGHIYIQRLAIDENLINGIVVYEYAPRLSNKLIRFSSEKEK